METQRMLDALFSKQRALQPLPLPRIIFPFPHPFAIPFRLSLPHVNMEPSTLKKSKQNLCTLTQDDSKKTVFPPLREEKLFPYLLFILFVTPCFTPTWSRLPKKKQSRIFATSPRTTRKNTFLPLREKEFL